VHLLGPTVFEALKTDVGIGIAAEVGVVLLLFQVGLETRLDEMKRVGISSLLVALLGVAAPMALGFVVGETLLPNHPPIVYGFLGATLAATSIGITARVMKDLGKTQTGEARIILGAAVIDDVIGLIILAVVSGDCAESCRVLRRGHSAWTVRGPARAQHSVANACARCSAGGEHRDVLHAGCCGGLAGAGAHSGRVRGRTRSGAISLQKVHEARGTKRGRADCPDR